MQKTVKAVIIKQEKGAYFVVLVKESPRGDKPGGFGFPGGMAEEGAENENELKREVEEETGMAIEALDIITKIKDDYNGTTVEKIFYFCVPLNNGDPTRKVPGETDGWNWFPLDMLPERTYRSHREVLKEDGFDELLWYHGL